MSDVKITPDHTPDLTQMDPILDEYRGQKGAVIPVLQKAQKIYGYLPPEVLRDRGGRP
jgi:NADH-quinone oxidoreductase subunit E